MPSAREIEAGKAFVRLFLKNDMSRQLVRALRAAQAKLRSFGQSATMMGGQLTRAGIAALVPFALSTRTLIRFDDAMREVAAVTQATGADFDRLTSKARELGASTSFTASEVALLMAELGRAGFTAQQIDNMTGSVLALSKATKTEGALSAGIMGAAIRQFGLGAGDAARVADVLTAGANKSFNTLESLGESLKYAGPVAHDFNMSLEDTVAVLGTLGNVGIQGSQAGSTMRRILLATGAEAEKLKGIFGVEFTDAAGNARPLVDTLQDIADVTKDLGTAERAKKFQDAFGLRGITGASAIGRNITGTRELRDAIADAGGIAEKTAAMMEGGLGGAFRRMMSAIEGVAIEIGEALAPTVEKLAKHITDAATITIKWVKANKGLVLGIATTAAAVTGLGVALIGVGTAATLASFAMGGLATIVSAIFSPIGLIVGVIGAATFALVKWTAAGQSAYRSVSKMLGRLLGRFKEVFGGIAAALQSGNFKLAFEILKAAARVAFAEIGGRVTWLFRELIPGLAAATWAGLAGGFAVVVQNWREPLAAFWEFFRTVAGAAFDFMVANYRSQAQLLSDLWGPAWELFKQIAIAKIQNTIAAFVNGFSAASEFIRNSLVAAFRYAAISFVGAATRAGRAIVKLLKGQIKSGLDEYRTSQDKADKAHATRTRKATEQESAIREAMLAGLAGQYKSPVEAMEAFGKEAIAATKAHAARMQAAGIKAANVIGPAGMKLAEATAGMSSEVREAFLERFRAAFADVKDYKDPKAVGELRARLAGLIAEATGAKSGAGATGGAAGGAAGGGAGGMTGAIAAAMNRPRIALTATYSAAAARIAGYGGGGPQEKMVRGIEKVAEHTGLMALQQGSFLAKFVVN